MTKLISFESGPFGTMAYLLVDNESRQSILIDTPLELYDKLKVRCEKENITVTSVLLTHGHFDHVGDGKLIAEHLQIPVHIHSGDSLLAKNPMRGFDGIPFHVDGLDRLETLSDGDRIQVGDISLLVIHTPGHTPGHCCYYEEKTGLLFSGDLLFYRSVGRTDLPGGDYETIMRSIIGRVFTLPDATIVYPGHGDSTTIGDEKNENPFVQEYRDFYDG